MLPFLTRKNHHKDDLIFEHWKTRFSLVGKSLSALFPNWKRNTFRFDEEDTENYGANIVNGAMRLRIKRSNLFAWIHDPWYRYDDFVVEAEVSFGERNKYSSLGFLIKYAGDDNYFYFLVSNRGYFRFDVVFNGNPLRIIPWTECNVPQEERFSIRIISHSNNYSFFINDEWIGEVENESISSGGISFAGQNYDEAEEAVFYLHSMEIESRPYEVEKQYYRWTSIIPADPEKRINLATSFYHQRQYSPALVQLRKAAKERKLNERELLMAGTSLMNLELYKEAFECMEKVLSMEPGNDEAFIGKAELLYLTDKLTDLDGFLEKNREKLGDRSILWNLLGNCKYALGNFEAAAEAYKTACEYAPDTSLIQMNAARACERIGETEKAVGFYLQASRLFFREEAYDDLAGMIATLNRLVPGNIEVIGLQGKMLFHEEAFDQAEARFNTVVEAESDDSSIYYLLAMIKARKGKREEAVELLRRAIELEDDFALYWFRYAENLFLTGANPEAPLRKALALSPEDPWINNFAGVYYLETNEPEMALDHLRKALQEEPDETEIVLNYAEALYEAGEKQEAFAFLSARNADSRVYNLLGNLSARENRYEEAARYYDQAINMDKNNPIYLENCATANIELDRITRAEELLVQCLTVTDTATVYNLMGNVARIRGEYLRAEAAYQEALIRDPEHVECRLNLADLYLFMDKTEQAQKVLDSVEDDKTNPRIERLYKRVTNSLFLFLRCNECGREWKVARKIGKQPPLRLYGEPPAEAPAGKCPSCGKILCIGCASQWIEKKRFVCPHCSEYLSLEDDHLRYLIRSFLR